MAHKKRSPRGILVVHDDRSAKVARLVKGHLTGKGWPISHRNTRYGYYSDMYFLVLAIGVDGVEATKNTLFFEYTPYATYQRLMSGEGTMDLRDYQSKSAIKIGDEVLKTLNSL